MKKVISTVLAMTLAAAMLCTGAVAVSEEQSADMQSTVDLQQLIEQSGLTDEEVAEAQEIYGDELPEVLEEYAAQADGVQPRFTPMGSYDWQQLEKTFGAGVILLSKDESFLGARHGHAAICYNHTEIVEHPGLGELSRRIKIADTKWNQKGAVATLLPRNITDRQRIEASNYAAANLVGWQYDVRAPRASTDRMNCATLVWKAYNAIGIDACAPGSGTVKPSQLDDSSYNVRLYATGQYTSGAWLISEDDLLAE